MLTINNNPITTDFPIFKILLAIRFFSILDFKNESDLKLKMLVSDGVTSLYVNDKCAFTARMYQSQGTEWGFFGIKSKYELKDVNIYK